MQDTIFTRNDRTHEGPETFRIVTAAGKEIASFTLDDKQPGVTLHLERQVSALESPVKRLEREAWSYYEALSRTLEKIEIFSPAAALALENQMFYEVE